MKAIKIKFTDFWPEFNLNSNIFLDHLNKCFNVIISDNPDYIIYSVFGHEYLKYDCIRIFYTSENIRPDFNLCDYALAFDWMTFEDRYMRFPVYMLYRSDLEKAETKHLLTDDDLKRKSKFCNFIYSNRCAHRARKDFFELLATYKNVDSGGRYLNNLGYCVKNKCDFQRDYKFSLAFENSIASGYTTEKIIQAYAAKTVPIYWGNPVISREFNPQSFINCHQFSNFADVLRKVIKVDADDELYLKMLQSPIYENINCGDSPRYTTFGAFLDNVFGQDLKQARRRSKNIREVYYENLRHFILNSRRFS